MITSILLLVIPSDTLFASIEPYFGKWVVESGGRKRRQLFDMDIINRKFSCHGKILVLPKVYGTLNTEFMRTENLSRRFQQCKNISQVYFMHFSGLGKPWTRKSSKGRDYYVQKYAEEAKPYIVSWFKLFDQMCQ